MTDQPYYIIANTTRATTLADRCRVARTFWQRGRGLLGRSALEPGEGLLIVPEWSVHTFFMRFAIDVVFLAEDYTVLKTYRAMPPNRPYAGQWGAHAALELPADTITQTATQVGDQLRIHPAASA